METISFQLISDSHERDLPSFTRLHIETPWLAGKAGTIISMRRSGKTWLPYEDMADLISKGTPKETLQVLTASRQVLTRSPEDTMSALFCRAFSLNAADIIHSAAGGFSELTALDC